MSAPAPAVFLDRDGTLMEEAGHLNSLDRVTCPATGWFLRQGR